MLILSFAWCNRGSRSAGHPPFTDTRLWPTGPSDVFTREPGECACEGFRGTSRETRNTRPNAQIDWQDAAGWPTLVFRPP
jgi:hypothetical protein